MCLWLIGISIIFSYIQNHLYYIDVLISNTWWWTFIVWCVIAWFFAFYISYPRRTKLSFWKAIIALVLSLWGYSFFTVIIQWYASIASLWWFIHIWLLVFLFILSFLSFFLSWTWIYKKIFKELPSTISTYLLSIGLWLSAFLILIYLLLLIWVLYPFVSVVLLILAIYWIWYNKLYLLNLWNEINLCRYYPSILLSTIKSGLLVFPLLGYWLYTRIFKWWNSNKNLLLKSWIIGFLILLIFWILYPILWLFLDPIVSRLLVVLMCFYYFFERKNIIHFKNTYINKHYTFDQKKQNIVFLLCVLSIVYIMYIFHNWYIPYPTARDANHAYLFYPKMWAFNAWIFRDNAQMAVTPHIWYGYITYWFSLFTYTDGLWYMSMDTIAIIMNAMSGFYVLIFWLWLISEVISLWAKYIHYNVREDSRSVWFLIWRWLLLAWLTSGMWAFLVIVDNKTDLGVLSLIILALYSWFIFLNNAYSDNNDKSKGIETQDKNIAFERSWLQNSTKKILILSWFFFAMAGLAKPTALFDAINFYSLLRWLILWIWWSLAIWLIILFIMSLISFRAINDYISTTFWYVFGAWWVLGLLFDFVRTTRRKLMTLLSTSFFRCIPFLLTLIVIKWLYLVPTYIHQNIPFVPIPFVERLFFSGINSPSWNLYASIDNINASECSLANLGVSDIKDLYANLKNVPWWSEYQEDVWRYIWYGWKWNPSDQKKNILPSIDPWWWFLFSEGCFAIPWHKEDARKCNDVFEWDPALVPLSVQSNTINVVVNTAWAKEIYLPYKYLVLANATFNWSLQNSGSYYTDIWFIRLILICLLPLSLIISLVRKNYIWAWLSLVTITGWILRWFVAWGIIWYGIWIIVRTILSTVVFIQSLTPNKLENIDEDKNNTWYRIFISIVSIFIVVQLLLNFLRIADMSNTKFLSSYRMHTSEFQSIWDNGMPITKKTSWFDMSDSVDVQFAHYKTFLESMNTRNDWDGARIAGTYSRYFVENQDNIIYDQFLTWMRRMSSDNNLCSTYLRLKDNNMKYLALDPNIGTVVQWAWNSSLFDRFFGKTVSWEIDQYWWLSLFVDLVSSWYANLLSTNNIAVKYAFSWDPLIESSTDLLHKYKLAAARYFIQNDQTVANTLFSIAEKRIENNLFLWDYADMFWKEIRVELLIDHVEKWITPDILTSLTEDEKLIISQFLQLKSAYTTNPDAAKRRLSDLIRNSISNPNQIIILELK